MYTHIYVYVFLYQKPVTHTYNTYVYINFLILGCSDPGKLRICFRHGTRPSDLNCHVLCCPYKQETVKSAMSPTLASFIQEAVATACRHCPWHLGFGNKLVRQHVSPLELLCQWGRQQRENTQVRWCSSAGLSSKLQTLFWRIQYLHYLSQGYCEDQLRRNSLKT